MRRLLLLPCLLVLLAAVAPSAAIAQISSTPPTATTRAANPVGMDTATLNGTVDPNGRPTSYRFEYGTTTAYGLQTADDTIAGGNSPVDVEAQLSNLAPDTTYHFRVIAWPTADPTAVVAGGDRSFRTIALPTVSSNSPRDTRADGATLDSKANPNRSPTRVHFEWGPTTAYGNQTPDIDIGSGSTWVEVSTVIGGLTPNTAYHFRLVATNAAGTKLGDDRPFKTLRQPTAIALASPVLTGRFGDPATIRGQVQGIGVGGIRIALESSPFPFLAPFGRVSNVVAAAADGTFSLLTPPLQLATRFRVVTATAAPGIASPTATVLTRLLVSASAQRVDRTRYRIAGSVTPRVIGAKVAVQRQVGDTWKLARRSLTTRLGAARAGYAVTVRRGRKATRLRVVVRPRTSAYTRTTSRTLTIPKIERP